MKCLARFNGRFTGVVCPCSSWSLQQSRSFPSSAALPCQLGSTGCWFWRRLLSRTIAFDSALPWCCSGKAHSVISQQPAEEESSGCVLLCALSLRWCLRAAPAAGQGNGFLMHMAIVSCMRVARGATDWKAMVAMHCTRCCFGFCTGAAHIRDLTSGFDVGGNGRGCPLCVLVWPFWHYHLVFSTAVSLCCVLLRGCSEEDKWKHKCNAKKKKPHYMIEFRLKLQ